MSVSSKSAIADSDEKSLAEAGAMDWHVRLMSGDVSRREVAQFERWLGESPANAEAYAQLADIWDGMGPLVSAPLVRESLSAQVNEGDNACDALYAVLTSLRSSLRALPAMAAVLFVAVAATVAVQYQYAEESVYRTEVGQREVVELTDGSTVMLNTASAVDVDFTTDERRVTLLDGQASFKVAKDAKRPFIVFAGEGLVRALGTEFDVYKSAEGVRVTLIEGRVRVASIASSTSVAVVPVSIVAGDAPAALTQVDLSPGEQAAIAPIGAVSAVEEVDIERVVAWREGKVSFRNTLLADAVAEMNRYSDAQIVLADDGELKKLRISGIFRVNNSDHFVNALESLFELEVRRGSRGEVILASAA